MGFITSICMDCFLGPPGVCQLKAAVLSKSSTLTGVVVRPLEIVIDPHGSVTVMYAFDLETVCTVSYQLLCDMNECLFYIPNVCLGRLNVLK